MNGMTWQSRRRGVIECTPYRPRTLGLELLRLDAGAVASSTVCSRGGRLIVLLCKDSAARSVPHGLVVRFD